MDGPAKRGGDGAAGAADAKSACGDSENEIVVRLVLWLSKLCAHHACAASASRQRGHEMVCGAHLLLVDQLSVVCAAARMMFRRV